MSVLPPFRGARILVVAPHPDDEVLGVGGTIARAAAEGAEVYVGLVTYAPSPPFDPALVAKGREEAARVHRFLGVRRTLELRFPAASIDQVPHADVNAALAGWLEELRPAFLFLPFPGDIHLDHQLIFQSGMVAARPNGAPVPRWILAYETLSETNWNAPFLTPGFQPNVYVDVSAVLEKKLDAMRMYASQLREPPHERSVEALRALAVLRGSTVFTEAAESFVLVRAMV